MDAGECGATITFSDPTATDNCAATVTVTNNGNVTISNIDLTDDLTDGQGNVLSP